MAVDAVRMARGEAKAGRGGVRARVVAGAVRAAGESSKICLPQMKLVQRLKKCV